MKWESAANFSRRESAVQTMRHSMEERTGGGGTEGERLRFNRQLINRQLIKLVNRQLIKEHGEAVLNHGAQRAQTHALAAGRG